MDMLHGLYRHYKGKEYEVIGVAKHSETEEELVVYRALYGERGLWVRPKAMFLESVQQGNQRVPRFAYIGPQTQQPPPADLFQGCQTPTDWKPKDGAYPVMGEASIMATKAHGTSQTPVQSELRYGCDPKLADRICNFNRHYAEHSGYFLLTSWLSEIERTAPTIYYDSNSGKPLFQAPIGRNFEAFLQESKAHGWPSFRDEEVNWSYVRVLPDGECVSVDGTHLGHNIPDYKGNRYCINLVSIAGHPHK